MTDNTMMGEWKIIDDDFDEISYGNGTSIWVMTDATIKVYEKRNLPVAANIILLFKCFEIKYHIGTPSQCFEMMKDANYIQPYKNEIEKLLVIS